MSVAATVQTRVGGLCLSTAAIAAAAAALAWYGWGAIGNDDAVAAVRTGELRYAGPVVLGFVLVVVVLEQLVPAQRRPVLARGHLMDLGYLAAYALVVLPLVTLLGAGSAAVLERHASWLTLPRLSGVPTWGLIVFGLLVIDLTDWFVHLVNHRINPLWRLHAVHHSQEEVSVLTTFRAHPLVHLSYAVTAVPGFVLAADGATPALLLTVYSCLGALPHANLRWSYGRLGRVLVSPCYHRLHHRSTGRTDVNLGVVFTLWDAMSGRAIFPRSRDEAVRTGLAGRPIPVEQAESARALPALLGTQWAEPFRRQQ